MLLPLFSFFYLLSDSVCVASGSVVCLPRKLAKPAPREEDIPLLSFWSKERGRMRGKKPKSQRKPLLEPPGCSPEQGLQNEQRPTFGNPGSGLRPRPHHSSPRCEQVAPPGAGHGRGSELPRRSQRGRGSLRTLRGIV